MKILISVFLLALCLFSNVSNAQWQLTTSGMPGNWISGWAVASPDDQTGFAGFYIQGQTPFYKTTDGGMNWTGSNLPFISFGSVTDIAASGVNNIWVTSFDSKILHSSDGGINWDLQFENTSAQTEFCYIEFFDDQTGIALGNIYPGSADCVILNTTNGGSNWNFVLNGGFGGNSGDKWNRIDFVNPSTGYFFPSQKTPASIYKTTDGGAAWSKTNYPSDFAHVLKFYSEEFGIANRGSSMFITKDGGVSWTERTLEGREGWGMDIEFIPDHPERVYFTEMYSLFFSSDSGMTWSAVFEIPENSQEFIRDIEFNDIDNGWMICDKGKFYRITNAGQIVGANKKESAPISVYSLKQNYPNPFNPTTKIEYCVPRKSEVYLRVYNTLGEIVAILVQETKEPGTYSVDFNGSDLPSGIYIYTLTAGEYNKSNKMVLLK
jgi:photosystem II stability/assembly factor-like uncharacterized protein